MTPVQTIRLILDAATANDFTAATKALDDYADRKYQVTITGDLNTYGQQLMTMEETRKSFPANHIQPINEIA